MNFYADEIGHGQHFRQQRTDILQMSENAFGVCVTFPAEHFIAVDGKLVEKILFLSRGFLDEAWKSGFDRLQFSRVHFEIGMKADEV